MAQAEQLTFLQETCLNPHGVQSWSSVTLQEPNQGVKTRHFNMMCLLFVLCIDCHLGHDEAVIVEVARVVVAVLHGVEEKHRHDLCHAAA